VPGAFSTAFLAAREEIPQHSSTEHADKPNLDILESLTELTGRNAPAVRRIRLAKEMISTLTTKKRPIAQTRRHRRWSGLRSRRGKAIRVDPGNAAKVPTLAIGPRGNLELLPGFGIQRQQD
jgi:hypothetical protein